VRDDVNGAVVPAGDSTALAVAIRRMAGDGTLRARLGRQAAQDVRTYNYDAWAQGFCEALASIGLARGRW
jgi:glycosyltransferase involved in cell wall biosynthesis